MNPDRFDLVVIRFLNAYAQHSWKFDAFMVVLLRNDLLKGVVIMALFWWGWLGKHNDEVRERAVLFYGMLAGTFGVLATRVSVHFLPFVERPLHNPDLNFRLPYTLNPQALAGWSSFPSDHMVLYACVAVALLMVNRPLGIAALCYTLIFIGTPRIYAGIHYPTDIVAGFLLGILLALFVRINWIRRLTTGWGMSWMEAFPGSFYAFMFICTYGMAEVFTSSRELVEGLTHFKLT